MRVTQSVRVPRNVESGRDGMVYGELTSAIPDGQEEAPENWGSAEWAFGKFAAEQMWRLGLVRVGRGGESRM